VGETSGGASGSGIVSKTTSGSVGQAVDHLVALIEAHGMKVFAIIDHGGEAARVGLSLRETKVVIFGSPAGGTPVMEASPLIALDLPLKVLVWDDDGITTVSYTDPDALATRHGLAPDLSTRLEGIRSLVDALVTS
jgi:uncharacterized protein (DUF302 family)